MIGTETGNAADITGALAELNLRPGWRSCDAMQYEGSIMLFVLHVVGVHKVAPELMAEYWRGVDQGTWLAVEYIHTTCLEAHDA